MVLARSPIRPPSIRPFSRSMSCDSRDSTMKDGEAAEMPVLEIVERLSEHDARRRAVAVDERRAGLRIGRQRRADDRDDRRDPGARGEEGIVAVGADFRSEAALRRGHIEARAGRELFIGEAREAAAVDLLDRDPQFILVRPRADRIGATAFLAVDGERGWSDTARAETRSRREADRERKTREKSCRRLLASVGDRKRMKLDHGAGPSSLLRACG